MLKKVAEPIEYNKLKNVFDIYKNALEESFTYPNNASILWVYVLFATIIDKEISKSSIEKDIDLVKLRDDLVDLLKPLLEEYIPLSNEFIIKELQRNINECISEMFSNNYIDKSSYIYKVVKNRFILEVTLKAMSDLNHSHILSKEQLDYIQDFDNKHLEYTLLNLQRYYDIFPNEIEEEYGDCLILNELAKIPKVKEYFQLPDTSEPLTWDDWVKSILSQKHKLYYDD